MYFPFVLRLYGHTLYSIRDHNYTGLDLFYHIKDCWKRRDTPHDLLLRPLERGLSFKIGEWCYDTMFDIEAANASTTKPYIAKLYKEDVLWFLEDVAEAAKLSGLFDKEVLEAIETRINEIGDLYDKNETEYWRQVDGRGCRDLIGMFFALCRNYSTPLSQLKELYASEIADRILHDRQLCNFLAETVMNIGFDGETHEGLRTQWMQRESWPSRVKTILNARDRGRCAACGVDIVHELNEDGHIDHMFPIASGGCNDLVNLQLLCSKCNLTKSDKSAGVTNSVPQYIRRPKKRGPGC